MPLVHIVLVNWNGWKDTVECVDSLLHLASHDYCITVCDNGSKDGSLGKMEAYFAGTLKLKRSASGPSRPNNGKRRHLTWQRVPAEASLSASSTVLTIIDGELNRGFAGGNNIGIKRALSDPECEFIWLLNNDTVVTPGALNALLKAMSEQQDLAICGSTLLFYHQPRVVQGLGGWYNVAIARGGHLGHMADAGRLPSPEAVDARLKYVMGASMFVRRHVFERTGGLSEDYFLYFEELDLAQKLLAHERQGWAPESVIYHKEGGSIGTSSTRRPSDTSIYYLHLSTLRYYRKYYPLLLPIAFLRLARAAVDAALHKDGEALRVIVQAGRDYLAGRKKWMSTQRASL